MTDLSNVKIGFAVTGSFCTFEKAFAEAEKLRKAGAELIPVMSYNASSIDSRFGEAVNNIKKLENICGRKVINTIDGAEPIGPKKMTDIIVVCPCTGNTCAKLAMSITDTPVTMAVKRQTGSYCTCIKRFISRFNEKYRTSDEYEKLLFCSRLSGRLS